jgi:hypothetical protein
MRFPQLSTLVTTFFYPAYAAEDLTESWSGTTESPSLKKSFTRAAALGSSSGEEARGLFGELFKKLEVRAVPGIRVEDQPGIR